MGTRSPYGSQLEPRTLPSTRAESMRRALSVPTLASARNVCAGKYVHGAPEMPREPKIVVVRGGEDEQPARQDGKQHAVNAGAVHGRGCGSSVGARTSEVSEAAQCAG